MFLPPRVRSTRPSSRHAQRLSLQHPPKKPPRSMQSPRSTRHAQHISAAPAQQDFTLIHSAVFQLIAIGVILLALPYRGLRKRYPYDGSPVNAP